jgi:hypothetical protein
VSRVFGRLLRTGLAGSTRGTCCALPSLGTVLAASAVVDPASPVHSRPSAASSSPAASLTAVLFATPSRAVGLRPRSARHASEHAPGTSGKWASPDSRLGSCHGVLRVRTILMNVGLVSDLVSTRLSKNTDCDHEKRERTAACYRRCRARSAPPRSAQSTATTPKPGMSFVFVAASDGSSPGCVSDSSPVLVSPCLVCASASAASRASADSSSFDGGICDSSSERSVSTASVIASLLALRTRHSTGCRRKLSCRLPRRVPGTTPPADRWLLSRWFLRSTFETVDLGVRKTVGFDRVTGLSVKLLASPPLTFSAHPCQECHVSAVGSDT